MSDWFAQVPPLTPSSIAPVPQDRPPIWLVLIALAVAVMPVAGFVVWGWS